MRSQSTQFEKNVSMLALHSGDSLYATKKGNIKCTSKWNVIGRFIHWIKDTKGERLHDAINATVKEMDKISDGRVSIEPEKKSDRQYKLVDDIKFSDIKQKLLDLGLLQKSEE